MAFFKFRKSGDEQSATPPQPESVEVIRRRARYRLTGAAMLVLLGVIGFPLLFDKQPRPISVDMPIEIPDKNKARPLLIPVPPTAPAASPDTAAAPIPTAAELPKTEKKASPTPTTAASKTPDTGTKAEPNVAVKPIEAPQHKADEGGKAQALLDGKEPEKKPQASEGRYVVQVGAFSDAARVREVRQKVEHAGLKTYTQEIPAKDGYRIRVRVGPFADKAEADKAVQKIKKLGLPAALLTL
jgi:DedD protein